MVGVQSSEYELPLATVGEVRLPTRLPPTKNSTKSTVAPLPPVAVAVSVSGVPGVARVGETTVPVGAVNVTVGLVKAAVTVAAFETLVLPRSSVAIASML